MYFIFALTTRAVAGLGVSMGCSYGIAGIYFPTQISTVIALLELANGLGLTLGPPLGGLMYELGGFQFPFWFVGGFVFVLFLISFFLFPKIEKSKSIEKNEKEMTVKKNCSCLLAINQLLDIVVQYMMQPFFHLLWRYFYLAYYHLQAHIHVVANFLLLFAKTMEKKIK